MALGACVLILLRQPVSRLRSRMAVAVALGYLVTSIYAVPEAIGGLLVGSFRPLQAADLPAGPLTIVVLGAGSITVRDWDGRRYVTTDPHASARVLEAVRVFRMAPAATVISSGGLLSPDAPGTPTGEAMAGALSALGVPSSQLLVETEARTTHEEAIVLRRMIAARPPTSVILVTSDVHMRRSVGAFHAVGLPVIPAIAQSPDTDLRFSTRWLPSSLGLGHSGLIAHELLGIVSYAARGWFSLAPVAAARLTTSMGGPGNYGVQVMERPNRSPR